MTAGMERERILSCFEAWLDRALTSEAPPAGIEAGILAELTEVSGEDQQPDRTSSYALWAALTALSQEVKLQGRTFKELNATLDSQPARIGDEIRVGYRERERDLQRETERRCRKEILSALIDLRDRLERGIESARACSAELKAPAQSWLERLVSKTPARNPAGETVAALLKGYELGLERLDQTLEDFNVRRILCLGQPFDPRLMNAIDREESDRVASGTVTEVYRGGYEWNGEVFRPAQVKVAVERGVGARMHGARMDSVGADT